jgi:hypothetical protein
MPLCHKLVGTIVATGLVFGLSACGSDDNATQPAPVSSTPPPTASPTPTPTAVDPTVAVKAKIMTDYKNFVATRSRGIVTNDPTFPYEQIMVGKALAATKSVATGANMIGTKYSGSVRFIKGEVVTLDLKAKPSTATVQSCVFDGLSTTSKSGKVTSSSTEVSRQDQMVLAGGTWKATETKSLSKESPGCA